MKLSFNILLASFAALACTSCNFLDVAPAKRADLTDAMKNKSAVENWVYGNYETVHVTNPISFTNYEGSADEFVTPDAWTEHARQAAAYGKLNATNMSDDYWRRLYGAIGNIHLFLRELEIQNPPFLTEDDKALYIANTHFLKGYYYFRILSLFGPCPKVDSYQPTDTPKEEFPGRYHFDYMVDYVCDQLDLASNTPQFPADYTLDESYGRGNKTVCAAIKSRMLLYAASPLWNGSFPYPAWSNTTFETPGYGKELVSKEFSLDKWYRAKEAAEEAIRIATTDGHRKLMDIADIENMMDNDKLSPEDLYIPESMFEGEENAEAKEEFLKRVMLMRYVAASDEEMGNHELIFTMNNNASSEISFASLPRNVIKNNNGEWYSGYAGISPTLEMVESFYTVNGKLPEKDPEFPDESQWLTSADIPNRGDVIKLNVNREPRFYAWILYDGCDVGPVLADGSPLTLDLKSTDKSGYVNNPSLRDQNQTGYLNNKFTPPDTRWTGNSNSVEYFPAPLIRLAELYLNLAECCAELYMNTGDAAELDEALTNLNITRKRAGVPELTAEDCTDDMTIRDWVRAERRIELFMEGHRYHDLRRWCIAEEHLKEGARTGLNSFVGRITNPTFSQFNQRVEVDGDYCWYDRMYLLPLHQNEVYNNPQMVQAPGY